MNYRRLLLTVLAGSLLLAGCREEIIIPKDPPVARKDMFRTALNTPITVAVLANDHDPNGEAMSLVSVGVPTAGTLVQNNDGTVTWTPPAGFTGGASFTYLMQDASGNQAESAAYITVGASTRVVYVSNFEDFWTQQVYMADTAHPGVAVPVSGFIQMSVGVVKGDNSVLAYGLSADRTMLGYFAPADTSKEQVDLYVVDLDHPGVATQITDIPDGRAMSTGFPPAFNSDNSKVLYMATLDLEETVELYMSDVANPANRVRVNHVLGEDESVINFLVTPDGLSAIYFVTTQIPDGPDSDTLSDGDFTEVWLVRLNDLANPVRINGGYPASGTNQSLANAALSPDRRTIAWAAAEDGSTTRDLYIADFVAGTPAVRIGGRGRSFGISDLQWSADGSLIAYRSDQATTTASEVFVVRLNDPNNSFKVGPTLTNPANGNAIAVSQYAIGADSSYVLYVRQDNDTDLSDTNQLNELFRVDLANPGVAIRINAPLAEDQDLYDFKTALAVPRKVLYTQTSLDADGDPVGFEIRYVDVDNPGVTTKIGADFRASNSVRALYSFSPDGTKVLYRGDHEQQGAWSIRIVDLTTPDTFITLTTEQIRGDEVVNVEFLP